jgi:Bacterial Ig-like domain (group 3)/FG-GAP-like repeat
MSLKRFSSFAVVIVILLSLGLTVFGQSSVSPWIGSSTSAKRPVDRIGMTASPGSISSMGAEVPIFFHGRSGVRRTIPKTLNSGPIFFNPTSYPSGGVLASSFGKFTIGGKINLVVANQCIDSNCETGGVSVFLGNGDGTFQAAQSYPSGGYEAYAVVVGDVNGDGKVDLIVANGCQSSSQCTNGDVGVLLGNGDGTFQSATSYSSGGVVASSVAIADVNKDGKADLVVANQCADSTCTSGGVSVLLGNGDGTFQLGQSYATGGVTAVAVVVGDFNGDRKIDLAVANQCQSSGSCTGNVGVLLGNGNGTFQAAQSYASGGHLAVSLATGDFNADHKIDLVVANQCQSGSCNNGNAGVLLGKGDGTFQPAQSYASGGNNTAAVVVGDLNGDGRADLVLTNQCQASGSCTDGTASVLLGKGDGTFQVAQNYLSDGVLASSVGVGDWNRDGKADLVIVNQCQTSSSCVGIVTVLLGNGDGTFQAPPSYGSGGYDADSAAVGDLNKDGNLDLVVTSLCQTSSCSDQTNGVVEVLLGNGDGTFRTSQQYDTGGFGASSVALADVNGDGKIDVVVANQCGTSDCGTGGSISVLLGKGDGTLQAAHGYPTGGDMALSVVIADVNNDGKADLVVANQCQDSSCQNGAVSVLLGNGDGTFQTARVYASGGFTTNSVVVGDFNGDGNLDLALASQCEDVTCKNGGVSALLGNGDGTFQAAQNYNSGGAQADSLAIADLNGDGKIDLVVSNLCQNVSNCSNGVVTSLLGKGDGTFRFAHAYSSGGQNAYAVMAGDFNGDGNQDAVVTTGSGTYALLGNGDGSFQTPLLYYPGGIFVAAGDFNGDEQPDAVVADGSLSTVTILLNMVTGFRQATSTTLASSPNPSSVFQSVVFTATVTTQSRGTLTGTVIFKAGTNVLGQATLSNGQAVLNYPFTSPGTTSIVAAYSGNSTFLPSNSAPLKQKVSKAVTTTTFTSSPNPSNVGQSVKFTATVAGQYGGTPTGSVTFKDGQTVLSQVNLSGGVAQYSTSTLSKGKHHIYADYGGDANFRTSFGSVIQVVQ